MLEAVLAAGSTALVDAGAAISGSVLAVSGMAISSPLVIPAPSQQTQQQVNSGGGKGSGAGTGVVMRCSLHPVSGEFQLSHAEHPGSKHSMQSAAGSLALVATAAAATMAVHAAAAVVVRTAALRRTLLGRALVAAAAGATGSSLGHATGSIVADSKLSTDGYLVPPPCMDACLHLGVAAPGCGAKVPVAVGAFAWAEGVAAPYLYVRRVPWLPSLHLSFINVWNPEPSCLPSPQYPGDQVQGSRSNSGRSLGQTC